ncbi:hypothetical protein [Methanobrevibacter sp.]|uniref:hypothetical protein n=1 Tax=Methanobrevibacter sp. TaxID=66852 RepID=UPI003865777C
MKIYEFEELVNKEKLCCYEGLTNMDEIPECVEQPFELWKVQGYFEKLYKAEENLKRCGFSVDVFWEYDAHCVEYVIYKEVGINRRHVCSFSGNVFSWKQVDDIAKALCAALNIEYKW